MEAKYNTIPFIKTNVLVKISHIESDSWFCQKVISITTGQLFSHLTKIKEYLVSHKEVVIVDFITVIELSTIVNDKYPESKCVLKNILKILESELYQLLNHEFGIQINVIIDFIEGIIIVNKS